MSSTATQVRQGGQSRVGMIGKTIGFISNLFVVLLIAMLTSIVIEYIGMSLWWEDEGVNHSRRMLQMELEYIGADLKHSLYGPPPKEIALNVSAKVGDYLMFDNGVLPYLTSVANDASSTKIGGILKSSGGMLGVYYEAASNIIQVFSIRCVIILLSAPVFAILVFCAFIDGLVQRELRKAGGGREYGFVYHQLKSWFKWLFYLPLFLYLASPFATHPNYIILPGAISVAILCFFISATFKKYL